MIYEWASGTVFPIELDKYDGIIHCGACMVNKTEMQYRINMAKSRDIPITNYGMLITYAQGILRRVLEPFPAVIDALKDYSLFNTKRQQSGFDIAG